METRLLEGEIEVKFAFEYTTNARVTTADDFSNFGWLRLATGIEDYVYPNLSHQKQLLEYLLKNSRYPRFVVTRVYHYLEFDLRQILAKEMRKKGLL